jgi:hypothetical protein
MPSSKMQLELSEQAKQPVQGWIFLPDKEQ